MAKNIVESIFNSKNNLRNYYPTFPGVKTFDLEKKHLLYGRIDRDGNAIYLDDRNLKQLVGGGTSTNFATDFVCEAFKQLKRKVKSAANGNQIERDSLYKADMRVYKAWGFGQLEYHYSQGDNSYLNKIYTTFVNSYLSMNRRHEKITNYKDFVREFIRFSLITAKYFPITKTGYITSIHCSPFASGLMLEIAPEQHGTGTNAKVLKYISDPNFSFFVNEVKKFGFMVDKNAPWRIVFNLASGMLDKKTNGEDTGAQLFMAEQASNYENVFQNHYRKAHLDELRNIRDIIYSLYEAYYTQFSTYEEVRYITCQKGQPLLKSSFSASDEVGGRLVRERHSREPPPDFEGPENEVREYWLKILLKLRMAETDYPHDAQNFNFFINQLISTNRIFGEEAALEYINNLTKGYHVSNFISKGSFWYGISENEYKEKLLDSKKNTTDPSNVDYPLIGTKNAIK